MINKMGIDNKNRYFSVTIFINSFTRQNVDSNKKLLEIYEDKFEPVLTRMNASLDTYVIKETNNNNKNIRFLFRTDYRKRTSLLRNQI
jgi:hypothetical protein